MFSKFNKFLCIALLLMPSLAWASEAKKLIVESHQPHIVSLVSVYLSRYHYQGMDLNDEVSKRLLNKYLEELDYNKMFFLESDINEFQAFATKLDDDLNAYPAKVDKAFLVFNRYRERLTERLKVVDEMLDKGFDFSKDEFYNFERHEQPWAKTKAELDDAWRKRLKEDMIRFKLQGRDDAYAVDILKKRYQRLLHDLNDWDSMDVLEVFLSNLAGAFDPHSSYFKPITKENFDIQMGHSLEGIGATLSRQGEYTVIVDLVRGGPAERSGELMVNDKIIAVGEGEKGEWEDVVDLRLDKVVKHIRGPKGSTVRLQVIPADATDPSETKTVTLVRDKVKVTSLDAYAEVKEVQGDNGMVHRVGLINIPSFYLDTDAKQRGERDFKSTTRDVRKLISQLEKQNIDSLLIDLRRNGGGSLDEAIELTGLFIDRGPVVQIRSGRGRVWVERDPDPSQVYKGPLVVLTSKFSASASEIFAGAIQDYGRGLVVGAESTHGKGTVQNVIPLQEELSRIMNQTSTEDKAGALKLTSYKFYRVSGGATQFKGVEPDVVLPSPYDGLEIGEDQLEYALPWDEIEPVPFRSYGFVRPSLDLIRGKSQKRIADDQEFKYLKEDLAERKESMANPLVSLNYEKRLAEKDAAEKRMEARKKVREQAESSMKTIPVGEPRDTTGGNDDTVDYILEEAVRIARDYAVQAGSLIAGNDSREESGRSL